MGEGIPAQSTQSGVEVRYSAHIWGLKTQNHHVLWTPLSNGIDYTDLQAVVQLVQQ